MALTPEGLVAAMDACQPQYDALAKQYANNPTELARQCKLVWATALINYLKEKTEVLTTNLAVVDKTTGANTNYEVQSNTKIK